MLLLHKLDKTSRNITEEDEMEDGYTVGHIVENFEKVKELEVFYISPEKFHIFLNFFKKLLKMNKMGKNPAPF
jgi:hypothetical protein